jgi:uncharacterized membrane protein
MILQVSAITILWILVIADLAKKFGWPVAGTLLIFSLFSIVPFTLSAIFVLIGVDVIATSFCIGGFIEFAGLLLLMLVKQTENEQRKKQVRSRNRNTRINMHSTTFFLR